MNGEPGGVASQRMRSVGAGAPSGSAIEANARASTTSPVSFPVNGPAQSWATIAPVSGQSIAGSVSIVDDVNWSIDAATPIPSARSPGCRAMYGEPPLGWFPALPAAIATTTPARVAARTALSSIGVNE